MSATELRSIGDRAAIVGIGHTAYTKFSGVTEQHQAGTAILAALDDAGLSITDVDGIARFDIENVNELQLVYGMGIPHLRFFAGVPSGGGAVAGTLVWRRWRWRRVRPTSSSATRARNRGKQSSHGAKPLQGGRPWAKHAATLTDFYQYHVPFGLMSPAQEMALIYRRHMHEFGTTTEQFGAVSVAQRAHAARNPDAVMREPISLADHQASRWIAEPLRLLDCCLETDGACAVIVTSAERAATAGSARPTSSPAPRPKDRSTSRWRTTWRTGRTSPPAPTSPSSSTGPPACRRATSTPRCSSTTSARRSSSASRTTASARAARAARFVAAGEHAWPHGSIPVNTHGGSLSEAYIHGYNHILEGVRQIRGTSHCQVEDCALVLVTSSNTDPTGAVLLRR
jgi:acetyl-CoA acetyltransferase